MKTVIARHYLNRRSFRIAWHKGIICQYECTTESAPENVFIAPALFDPQINGYAGVDFQQDDLTVEHLLHASRHIRLDGCSRYFLTLITDEWPRLLSRLRKLHKLRCSHPELAASIAGWHIEGPFLSEMPGYCGAHNPAFMLDPTPSHMAALRSAVGDDRLLLTLAPERKGALDSIHHAVRLDIRISLGHTNADAECILAAVQAGATGFTHLGNGCPRELNRHDNILFRVLNTPGLTIGMIPDTQHVSPTPFNLFHRLLPQDKIYYTTDAMAAAAGKTGHHKLGTLELEVGEDRIVRLPGTPYFAGSALRPFEGVERSAQMLKQTWRQTWQYSSINPARFLGLECSLRVGAKATFCLVKENNDGSIMPITTVTEGYISHI